jgi:hypothetical protein
MFTDGFTDGFTAESTAGSTAGSSHILVRAHKDPFKVADAATTLRRNLIGSNVGNLVFSQATFRLLSVPATTIDASPLEPAAGGTGSDERIDEAYDHVVIPLANAFRSSFVEQLTRLTELIERLTVPVTILGVGAQARLSGAYGGSGKVDPIARRFVRAVLDRGPSIGVRGERTREYLRGLGFGDDVVRVVGCPSMFMFGPDLPALRPAGAITGGSITGGSITGGSITGGSITGGSITGGSRIALTVSPYVARMGPISLTFAERYPGLVYVAQNRETLSLLLTGQYPLPDREAEQRSTGVPISLDHPLLASGRTVFCLDPKSWFAELATYDLCFGSRIHGAIAALLAGTPAVVLAHDARTLELAEYHEIPFREIPADPAQADPARLAAESDWSGLHSGHHARWETFAGYLTEHGLRHAYDANGDRGAAFDARLALTDFPPPVRPLTGPIAKPRYALRRFATLPGRARKRLAR